MDRDHLMRRRAARRRTIRRRRLTAGVIAALVVAGGVTLATRGGGSSGTVAASAAPAGASTTTAAPAPAPPVAGAAPLTIAAVGDTVMGSPPYGLPPDGGRTLFDGVDDLLTGDVVLVNLEGTLATGGSSKCGSGSPNCFAFRTPPSYARWLKEAGVTVANLANNHAYDFGPVGLRQTVAALSRVGIRSTGRPGTRAVQTVEGRRVAVLGFAAYRWADPLLDIPAARRRVQAAARTADTVIVTFHGGAEGSDKTRVPRGGETYLGESRGDSRAFARAVVDAGADLVVGHGPHVLRGMEVYRGRLIAYSLGNFMGYEVFSLGGPLSTSAVLQVSLNADGTLRSGRIRPVQLVGAGVPVKGGDAIGAIRRLSAQDFGARSPRITANGTIRPRT